jgi:hypothetical protein
VLDDFALHPGLKLCTSMTATDVSYTFVNAG